MTTGYHSRLSNERQHLLVSYAGTVRFTSVLDMNIWDPMQTTTATATATATATTTATRTRREKRFNESNKSLACAFQNLEHFRPSFVEQER